MPVYHVEQDAVLGEADRSRGEIPFGPIVFTGRGPLCRSTSRTRKSEAHKLAC
jgi:hypothetical protein